jgi:probable F420-dependent oxidoreductase
MKYGVVMFPTDYSIDPVSLAREVEARGFESLFFPEHTHIPASRRTPWPGGAELPKEYYHIHDPFIALTAAAMVTEKLLIGTGICLVTEHEPIALAKAIASIDQVSGGRFLFGIGAGWNVEEMANHGTDADHRFAVMRERVQAMKRIWTEDEAEFHGKYVDFDPLWSWPKPAQQPHPPVLVGGSGKHTFKRVLDYGDGWMPIPTRGDKPLSEQVTELQALAADAGRGRIPVTVYGTLPRPEVIQHYHDIGIDRCIFWLPSVPRDEALPQLDRYAALMEEVAKAGA